MKKISSLFLFSFSCFLILNGQSGFLKDNLTKWQNGLNYTEEVILSMPDSLWTFKPSSEEMSFREQTIHITQNMYWLCSSYLKGKDMNLKIKDTGQTVTEIKAQFKEIGQYTTEVLGNLEDSSLTEKVNFFAGNFTRWQIIQLLHDHHTHHRGQLIVYLRLKNIKPPKYIGW